jgi:ornithine cyclodeaminase/alanine dehydrogenase-like protein (mu-crystallin family)
MTLLLARADVQRVLDIEDAIEALTAAHVAQARGEVVMPVRLTMRYDERPSELEAMPAYVGSLPALGVKVIEYVGTNAARGLPAITALIVLFDPDDGRPQAVIEGSYITATRTAAASALATRLLAREDASVLAIAGPGVQGRRHLDAMLAVRPFCEVRIAGRGLGRAEAFVADGRAAYPEVRFSVASSAAQAVAGADVVVTATTSPEPILRWSDLDPGTHINAIGSHSPDTRELATDLVVNARRFVDSRDANLKECGDFLLAIAEGALSPADIGVEIGQVAAGLRPGRTTASEVTLYKSGGIALQDVATAHLVYQRARERGLGVEFEF